MTHLVPVIRPVLGTPFRRGEFYRRAGAMPAFHIAPARTQTAADLITGSVLGTYNSATPAMAVGPDGVLFTPAANAPVIEYDPVTLACLGARVWGVVTNLLPRSEEFNDAAWTKAAATVTANQITSPKGDVTADKLVESATNAEHLLWRSRTGSNETLTFSVYAKAAERTSVKLAFSNFSNEGRGAIFNLATGSITSIDAAGTDYTNLSASIAPAANGFYRCSFTATKGTVNTTNNPAVSLVSGSSITYAGDGTSGAFIWGAQLNTGGLAPYVPTTTTSASSTADVWSITGSDFTRIYNQSEGTAYFDARSNSAVPSGAYPMVIQLQNLSNSDRIALGFQTGSQIVYMQTAGAEQAAFYPSTFLLQNGVKTSFAFATNNVAVSSNGILFGTDNSATLPTCDRLFIGSDNVTFINGYIRELALFRSRLPNSNLQAMTS